MCDERWQLTVADLAQLVFLKPEIRVSLAFIENLTIMKFQGEPTSLARGFSDPNPTMDSKSELLPEEKSFIFAVGLGLLQ